MRNRGKNKEKTLRKCKEKAPKKAEKSNVIRMMVDTNLCTFEME